MFPGDMKSLVRKKKHPVIFLLSGTRTENDRHNILIVTHICKHKTCARCCTWRIKCGRITGHKFLVLFTSMKKLGP